MKTTFYYKAGEKSGNQTEKMPIKQAVSAKSVNASGVSVNINSIDKNVDTILKYLHKTIWNINEEYTIEGIREQLLKIIDILYNNTAKKYKSLKIEEYSSGKMQSCAWLFINTFIDINDEMKDQLNKILVEMSILNQYVNEIITNCKNIDELNLAKDLNKTMELLKYPISFHDDIYGKHADLIDLRRHNGESSLRRPIAKTELVIAWLAEILRENKDDSPEKHRFIKALGLFFNIFIKRKELIRDNKLKSPVSDVLVFIRLMEIVYVYCINKSNKEVYKCFSNHGMFKYIKDFNDIRLSDDENSVLSNLSYVPRLLTDFPGEIAIYYNPVKCEKESPIYYATSAWKECQKSITTDQQFENIKQSLAEATFAYEKIFAGNPMEVKQANAEKPSWYDTEIILTNENLYEYGEHFKELRENIKIELDKNNYKYDEICFSVMDENNILIIVL